MQQSSQQNRTNESLFQETSKNNSLNLKWTVGFNYQLFDGVQNITTDTRKEILFASAHTGVIYDYENNTQRLLQGHCNKITATAYCPAIDVIITADSGSDSMMVVWDAKTGNPLKTIFDQHTTGTQALDISSDGQYIVSLAIEAQTQNISIWIWQEDSKPFNSCDFDIREENSGQVSLVQSFIRFSQDTSREFVTTGRRAIFFWSWDTQVRQFDYYKQDFDGKKFLTQSTFIPDSTQVVSGTTDGYIVVWDISLIMENYSKPEERRNIKSVNLINTGGKSNSNKKESSAINILKIQDNYLVVGSSSGAIRFYDFQYRIIAWFENMDIGPITSVSFSSTGSYNSQILDSKEDEEKPLVCPDFIVVDLEARITLLKPSLFEEIDPEKKKGQVLIKSIESPVLSLSLLPNSKTMVMVCDNGQVIEWNYYEKQSTLEVLKQFDKDKNLPTTVKYSPDGKFLAVATENGTIFMYEVNKMAWVNELLVSETQKQKKIKINQIQFASDSKHLATMDSELSVCLFKIDHKFLDKDRPKEWVFYGKVRVHTMPIRSITFVDVLNEKGEQRLKLFSTGEDKKLVEYDVHESTQALLKIISIFDIEQEVCSTCCIQYPCNMFKEDVLLTVNEEYKLKLWLLSSNQQKICKKTCLGPSYGKPINKLLSFTTFNNNSTIQQHYLAYSTKEKIIGLIKLPLDGNPNSTMGLISHPGEITDIAVSNDGKFLMTSGGNDFSVNIWEIQTETLEKLLIDDKEAMGEDPFPQFLEGGADGQIYLDLKDFFYYAQIRAKDEHTTKARKLDGMVPLENISEMMRALGHYPTNKEIENMMNEVKYSQFLETGQYETELNLSSFVKLFVNHRPVYGIVKSQIEEALTILKQNSKSKGTLTKDEFLDMLQKDGEKMSLQEIKDCFAVLTGNQNGDLPEIVDSQFLVDQLLGFEDMDISNPEKTAILEYDQATNSQQ